MVLRRLQAARIVGRELADERGRYARRPRSCAAGEVGEPTVEADAAPDLSRPDRLALDRQDRREVRVDRSDHRGQPRRRHLAWIGDERSGAAHGSWSLDRSRQAPEYPLGHAHFRRRLSDPSAPGADRLRHRRAELLRPLLLQRLLARLLRLLRGGARRLSAARRDGRGAVDHRRRCAAQPARLALLDRARPHGDESRPDRGRGARAVALAAGPRFEPGARRRRRPRLHRPRARLRGASLHAPRRRTDPDGPHASHPERRVARSARSRWPAHRGRRLLGNARPLVGTAVGRRAGSATDARRRASVLLAVGATQLRRSGHAVSPQRRWRRAALDAIRRDGAARGQERRTDLRSAPLRAHATAFEPARRERRGSPSDRPP